MNPRFCRGIFLCLLLAGTTVITGCLGPAFGDPPAQSTPAIRTPVPTQATAVTGLSDMALVKGDLPGDYSILDRTVIPYDETSQLSRNLGWIQGYRVVFVHRDHSSDSITGIRQVIAVYSADRINQVYALEKETLLEETNGTRRYEIAFPKLGEKSVAVRITGPDFPINTAVYSVLFIKGTVCEQITMGGTATDYEALKTIAQKAAEKIP